MGSFKIEQLPLDLKNAMIYYDLFDGEILFYQNEPAKAIFVVDSGSIKLVQYTDAGQIINHYSVKPGEYFSEVGLFHPVYICTAIAEKNTRVLSFPKQLFVDTLQRDINLSKTFMEQLAWRLYQTKLLLELRGIRSARERILHYLRVSNPNNEKIIHLEQPLKDIANDIGITPEVLSRTLSQLQNEGIFTRHKRRIIFQ